MDKKKVLAFAGLAVLIGAISVAWNTTYRPAKKQSREVTIAYLPVVQSLPLYLAMNKGYFAKKDIAVRAVKFEAPNQIIDALLSGQADVAVAAASGITALSQEKKPDTIKAFSFDGSVEGIANDVLVARKDGNLRVIADLRGKRLGRIPGIQFKTIAQEILARNGLAETDLEIVEIAPSLQIAALAAGQVDAVLGLEPLQTIATSKGIGKSLVANPMVRFIASPWWGGASDITTKFLSERPDLAKDVMRILIAAQEEIEADPDAARIHLKEYTPLDDDLIAKVPLALWKSYRDFSSSDVAALQTFVDTFKKHGVLKSNVEVGTFIYSDATTSREN